MSRPADPRAFTIGARATLKQAIEKLTELNERTLFVTENDLTLLGAITDGDIRRALLRGASLVDAVTSVMAKSPLCVPDDLPDKAERLRELFLEKEVFHIPLVDSRGRIVTIVFLREFIGGRPGSMIVPAEPIAVPVVIMAGGKGKRLDAFTSVLPKPLIPYGGVPVIEVVMRKFFEAGARKFHITVNYRKEVLLAYFAKKAKDFDILWTEEPAPLGSAGGLKLLEGDLGGTFIVSNCDIIFDLDVADLLASHRASRAAMTIVASRRTFNVPFGVIETDADGQLVSLAEKPQHNYLVNAGIYVMEPEVLGQIHANEALSMDSLVRRVSDAGGTVHVYTSKGTWYDIGNWVDYRRSLFNAGFTDELL